MIGKTKIILSAAPTNRKECIMDTLLCNSLQYCWCEKTNDRNIDFDFSKCPYCEVLKK